MCQGVLFFLGTAVAVGCERCAQFVEYGFVVLLPSLTEIIALARLHLDEIVAREGKNSRGSRGRKPYHQITGEKVMNFCQIRDLREARHWSLGGLLAFLGCRAICSLLR